MAESDQAAMAFITPYGPFGFNTMPFGLKNTGSMLRLELALVFLEEERVM